MQPPTQSVHIIMWRSFDGLCWEHIGGTRERDVSTFGDLSQVLRAIMEEFAEDGNEDEFEFDIARTLP